MKPRLLVIRGYAGSGKTTLANALSKKHGYYLVELDSFLFGYMRKYIDLSKKDWETSIKIMNFCFDEFLKQKKNIILEGSLVAIEQDRSFDVKKYIKKAKGKGYSVKSILLTNSWNKSKIRTKQRGHYVKKELYEALKNEVNKIKLDNEFVLNTNNISEKNKLKKVEKFILKPF